MKSKFLFIGFIYSLIGALLLMQTNIILAIASNDGNPITAPITPPVTDPTPTPSPEPVTPPVTNPTPTPDPLTPPITNPTPTPSPTPIPPAPAQQNQPGNASSQPGNPEPPVCGDSKPVSTPRLLVALASGRNQVALVWSKALDPVSYYLVAYGTKPGQPEFGNPNIGGKDTVSFIVSGLSGGKTYYFKVRAGNGCMPGDFSNEIAVKVAGSTITAPAAGFKAGVLGATKRNATTSPNIATQGPETIFKPITSAKPERVITGSGNFLIRVLNFFTNIFKR